MYVCMFVYVCIYVCMYVYMYVCMYVCLYVYLCVCVCVCVCVYVCVCVFVFNSTQKLLQNVTFHRPQFTGRIYRCDHQKHRDLRSFCEAIIFKRLSRTSGC